MNPPGRASVALPFRSAVLTGATGFIGAALLRRLLALGVETTCPVRDLSRAPHAPGARFVPLPRWTAESVRACVVGQRAEAVFHLAAYGSRGDERDPDLMREVNLASSLALYETAAAGPLKAFVFTGTGMEYGHTADRRRLRENDPTQPDSIYGRSRLETGDALAALSARVGAPFARLRLFSVYGPGDTSARFIPAVARSLRRDEPMPLTGGDQVRDFAYLDDIVDALLLAAAGDYGRMPFNVCSGDPVSLRDVGLAIARAMGKPESLLQFGARPYRPDDSMYVVGDPSAWRAASGWAPRVPFAEGVARTVAVPS